MRLPEAILLLKNCKFQMRLLILSVQIVLYSGASKFPLHKSSGYLLGVFTIICGP